MPGMTRRSSENRSTGAPKRWKSMSIFHRPSSTLSAEEDGDQTPAFIPRCSRRAELHQRVTQAPHFAARSSAQIQALEAELGVQLFARNRRSVRLSKPGETFLRSTEAILQMADEAKADAQRVPPARPGISG